MHTLRPGALDAALLLVARRQHGAVALVDADRLCRSFTLDEALDIWMPSWREDSPPAGMGRMSQRLHALTYCIFVGIWDDRVGFVLEHPERLNPKCVTFAITHKDHGHPRAHLAVQVPAPDSARVMVSFPRIDDILLANPRSGTFEEARRSTENLVYRMVERVNLIAPAALLLHS